MYKRILVPTDGSALAADAVRKAVEFARALGAKIIFFHAKPNFPIASYSSGGLMESISPAPRASAANPTRKPAIRRTGRHRCGDENGLRADLHGVPRTARDRRQTARQRNPEGADPLQNSRSGLPPMKLPARSGSQAVFPRILTRVKSSREPGADN